MNKFNINKSKLSSQLPIVFLPRRETQTVTLLALIGVGSRYEATKQSGLSHFLEHMFFKGTEKRPTAKEIAEAIDNLGGEFNAFTGEEYTGFYVKVAAEHLAAGADVVADILLHPLFPSAEIERERGVITEEIRMYTDTPMRHVWHLWHKALFGAHPLGRRIDGSLETVAQLKRQDFLDYATKHYRAGNAVVTVAGNFDAKKTKQMLSHLFADLPSGTATKPKPAPAKLPRSRFVFEQRLSLDQTHLLVGVPGLKLTDKQRWAAELLATILGSGMSSRLFISVRERRGLAYSIRTSHESYTDTGSFVTQAGVRTDKAAAALALILKEYDLIAAQPIKEAELSKAKQMLNGQLLLELEETNALALFAGMQSLLLNKITTPAEITSKINRVTAQDIQKLAQTLLAPKKTAVALLGPQTNTNAFEKLLK